MNVPLIAAPKNLAGLSLEKLAGQNNLTEGEKLVEASRQFESVLLRQILGDARKPVFQSKLTERSAVSDIYDDMVTTQLADSISRSGEFGLARSLVSQLQPAGSKASNLTDSKSS